MTNTEKETCGCRGIRTCLLCESNGGRALKNGSDEPSRKELYQCFNCGRLLTASDAFVTTFHPLRQCGDCCVSEAVLRIPVDFYTTLLQDNERIRFDGVLVIKNFVTLDQESTIVKEIDSSPWADSQSGRRKQDYGPKVNFKKAKVKLGPFNGFPSYSKELVMKLSGIETLRDFAPVELCNLDYDPSRGSAIDPHLDDSWIWGERLITLNLLSHTYLSFTHPRNLVTLHIPLPRLSLVIVMGTARYLWSHSITRKHVVGRRIAMTMRELGKDFLEGNKDEEIGRVLLRIAGQYSGKPVNFH